MADIKKKLKMALISGANTALKYKNQNSRATDEEIIQQINRESNAMVEKIDSEE